MSKEGYPVGGDRPDNADGPCLVRQGSGEGKTVRTAGLCTGWQWQAWLIPSQSRRPMPVTTATGSRL